MMAAVFEKTFIQDLTGRLIVRYCPEIVFSKDNLSNRINVKLYVGPNEYAGGGTVTATVIRSDGNTAPFSGSISGNVVSVTLIEACMDVPGQIQVFIRLTSGNVKTTIFAGVFTASRTETDTIIDPGTIIPSITELINQIDAAIDSIPADYSTLLGSVAGTYSASKTYAVGDYVWYNGQLYRCITAITTPEAWTAAHWTIAVIGDDVSSLKGALTGSFVPFDFSPQYAINKGAYISSDTGIRTSNSKFAYTGALYAYGKKIAYELTVPGYVYRLSYYDATANITDGTGYISSGEFTTGFQAIPSNAIMAAITFRREDSAALTDDDIAALTAGFKYYAVTDTSLTKEGYPADAAVTGEKISKIDAKVGEPVYRIDDVEYTIVNGKKFNNRGAGNTMNFSDNSTYHYILLSVTPGEKYDVTTYFTSANTYYIYMCNSNGLIVSRDHNATGVTGSQEFIVDIPEGVAQLYIQGYSSAAAIAGRMSVKKYTVVPFRDAIAENGARIEAIEATSDQIKINDASVIAPAFVREFMRPAGSIDDTETHYARSRIIAVYAPSVITINGYFIGINQYLRYNYSSSMLVKSYPYGLNSKHVIYADTFPIYIMVGLAKEDRSEVTAEDLAAMDAALTITSLYEPPLFASIAMYPKFAITGCSWDAGTIYESADGHVTHTGAGWAEILGRRNGCAVGNFAIGGSNLRSWFNYENHANGFPALLQAEAYPLYILTEGNSNDANAFEVNDSDYSPTVPSTTKYYVGTVEDISTRQDYHDYPCTFFGYYGRVIEMIQEHAPKTMIIISSPDTTPASSNIRRALQDACLAIAEYYGLPYMDIQKDPYYDTYVNALVGYHPTAPTYSGWAMAIERCFAKCVENNLAYFQKYSGVPIMAVTVPWEPVELT